MLEPNYSLPVGEVPEGAIRSMFQQHGSFKVALSGDSGRAPINTEGTILPHEAVFGSEAENPLGLFTPEVAAMGTRVVSMRLGFNGKESVRAGLNVGTRRPEAQEVQRRIELHRGHDVRGDSSDKLIGIVAVLLGEVAPKIKVFSSGRRLHQPGTRTLMAELGLAKATLGRGIGARPNSDETSEFIQLIAEDAAAQRGWTVSTATRVDLRRWYDIGARHTEARFVSIMQGRTAPPDGWDFTPQPDPAPRSGIANKVSASL